MAKKDRSRHILPSGDLFLRETRKTEPTSPLRTPQPTDWERRTGGNQLSWSLHWSTVLYFVFFLQQKVYRKLQRAGCSEAIIITVDQCSLINIFQCCIWYMSNLQHVNEILFLQPRNPYITLKPTLIMFVGFCAALYEHLFCAFSLNSNSGVVLQSSVIWFSANNSPNLWFLIDLIGT